MIDDAGLLRYSRQIMLPDFDVAGQEKLLASRVLVVGLGGLGSPVALYLAAAGIGSLHLADGDAVDVSNLQRQIAHGERDLNVNKAESAAAACKALNPGTELHVTAEYLDGAALTQAVSVADLVVDATDSFAARLQINRACIRAQKPLVSGAAVACEGQVTVFDVAQGTGCYRCLYPQGEAEPQLSCSESGVLSPIVGLVGSLQALEAIKRLTGYGDSLAGSLLLLDGRSLDLRRLKTVRNPDCPDCSLDPTPAGA
ncbi:MAG: molybdopterin-synthase adenylyltransferase MoeB [Pseudomonadota bacterium]